MIISLFCYGFTTLYFANVVSGYFFPEQTNALRCNIGWNCFKYYTIASMYVNNFLAYCAPVVNLVKRAFIDYKPHYFEVVKDGLVVQKEFYNTTTNFSSYKLANNDFILYYVKIDNANNTSKYDYNVLRVDNAKTIDTTTKPDPMESKVSFLSISIKLQPSKESIEVIFGRNNFYNANNALFDSPFVKYYLYSYDKKYNDLNNEPITSYNVVTLDSNINSINFDEGSYIRILKNSFVYQLSQQESEVTEDIVRKDVEVQNVEVQNVEAQNVEVQNVEVNNDDNESTSSDNNDYEIVRTSK